MLGGFVLAAEWIKTITCENTIQNFVFLRQGLELFCRSLTSRSQRSAYLYINCLYHHTQRVPILFDIPGCSLIRAFFFPQPVTLWECLSSTFSSFLLSSFLSLFCEKGPPIYLRLTSNLWQSPPSRSAGLQACTTTLGSIDFLYTSDICMYLDIFVCVMLEIESKTLCMLGKCSITELHLHLSFCLCS